jgi:response regulator RpfG family c-di-GMP phosphodiesterase
MCSRLLVRSPSGWLIVLVSGESLIVILGQIYERWDGKGLPRKLKGDQVALAVQVVTLAQDAVFWNRIGGPEAAVATVRKRSGGAHQPRLAERYCEEVAHPVSPGARAVRPWCRCPAALL